MPWLYLAPLRNHRILQLLGYRLHILGGAGFPPCIVASLAMPSTRHRASVAEVSADGSSILNLTYPPREVCCAIPCVPVFVGVLPLFRWLFLVCPRHLCAWAHAPPVCMCTITRQRTHTGFLFIGRLILHYSQVLSLN